MPTKQRRNAELVANLKPDFTTRPEFYHAPARLNDALYWPTRFAGGYRRWAWQATSANLMTSTGDNTLTGVNISAGDFGATDHGGTWIDLDGASEYMWIADAVWQEAGAATFFVWSWVQPATLVGDMVVVGHDLPAANRSWSLHWNVGVGQYRWLVSGDGAAGFSIDSSYPETAGDWNFIACWYDPSTIISIWVGEANDPVLVKDSLAVAIPASLFDGVADFAIGARPGPTRYWDGKISNIGAWSNLPATYIDAHVAQLFHTTRWFYQ